MKILKWIGVIILFLIVLSVITPPKNNYRQIETKEPVEKIDIGITMEKFNEIQEGMTYEEVITILGKEGEVISSSDLGGYKTIMYTWNGRSLGANMNAMFQNNKMVSKAQFGLK